MVESMPAIWRSSTSPFRCVMTLCVWGCWRAANRPAAGGYQWLANFINARYLEKQGSEKAVRFWRYLADTRNDPAKAAQYLENGCAWATVAATSTEDVLTASKETAQAVLANCTTRINLRPSA